MKRNRFLITVYAIHQEREPSACLSVTAYAPANETSINLFITLLKTLELGRLSLVLQWDGTVFG